jgi:hypothetical protein
VDVVAVLAVVADEAEVAEVAAVRAVDALVVCPEYDSAAKTENPPVSAAHPVRTHRVTFDTLLVPASLALIRLFGTGYRGTWWDGMV